MADRPRATRLSREVGTCPELQKDALKEIGFEPMVPKTALDIVNQAKVCFALSHGGSLKFNCSFEFQREELSNGFRVEI